ncbi:MAG: hypothetical protein OHK0039_32960 [Bacteroidia bacterium]
MLYRLLPLLLLVSACHPFYIRVAPGGLPAYLSPDNPDLPPVSGHRGARYYEGLPENSMPVFRHVLRHTPALLECDISLSRDSVLVLMHDDALDRTTTGTGLVSAQTWRELRRLRLEDDGGTATRARIPRLDRVLRWADGKTILTLDVKRGVPWEAVIDAVRAADAADHVVVITYSLEDALRVHALAPDLVLSVSISSDSLLQRYLASPLPPAQMLAFTGTRLGDAAHYRALRAAGIVPMLGSLGRIDREAAAQGTAVYDTALARGVGILATDRPVEAAAAVQAWRQRQK